MRRRRASVWFERSERVPSRARAASEHELRARLRDEQSFGMDIACRLNFLQAQASVALDPGAAPEQRAYASSEISDTLARLPMPSLISHLTSLATATLG